MVFVLKVFRKGLAHLCTRTTLTRGLCMLLIMDVNGETAWVTRTKLKYLKICVIDALKDKRWGSGLQREDNTRLNRGKRQVGGAHYHCMDTHSQLQAWQDCCC